MNGLSIALAGFVASLLATALAAAQTVPAPPVSHGSPAGAPGKPAKPASTPVVTAPPNVHAQKPAPAKPGATGKPVAAAAAEAATEAPKPAEPPKAAASAGPKLGASGLPLPRWASLRADEVNMRSGPGTRYPIEWVYHRRDLPVQIEREFEGWRLIEDPDGVKGWVHQATLVGRRSFVVKGTERVLRHAASEDGAAVARLKPGVVGRIRGCELRAAWCEVQAGDYHGFLKREEIYGVNADEAVN